MSSNTSSVADLIGEHVLLRLWSETDLAAVRDGIRRASWAADFPADGDRVIAGMIAETPEWAGEFGHRLILERESVLAVGSIGLFWPPEHGAVEIGYGIVPSRRGRGLAAEATRLLTAFAFTEPRVDAVFATVETTNPASIRVLEKAGFERWSVSAADGTERWGCRRDSPNPLSQ
ncbi:GNAT family N-acetyltransferase [Nocardia wallacei]|uniref:GNAT family N-acetyltransferase n=1 Tax=Nocardia wallacei TaxID=480035 RepID=UPI002454076D|nr:GNAT family N-acetyltransferase [Nocardia wallacei]